MAWPPATLPTNRTNATPQNNTHPADHNAISAAINDTVVQLQTVTAGQARVGLLGLGAVSIPTNTTQFVTYSALSTSAWGAGPTYTAPAGVVGWFAVSFSVLSASDVTLDSWIDLALNIDGDQYLGGINWGRQRGTVSAFVELAAGATISTVMDTTETSPPTIFGVRLAIVRVSI